MKPSTALLFFGLLTLGFSLSDGQESAAKIEARKVKGAGQKGLPVTPLKEKGAKKKKLNKATMKEQKKMIKVPYDPSEKLLMNRLKSGTLVVFVNGDSFGKQEARKYCQDIGMDYPIIDSMEKSMEIMDAARNKPASEGYWTSASDEGQRRGQLVWPDGAKVDAALWAEGEPTLSRKGKDTCVFLNAGKLYGALCTEKKKIVCELAKKDQGCLPSTIAQ